MSNLLPDCMMPDGADPCAGYQSLAARVRELEAKCSNHAWQENEQCKRAERAEAERDDYKAKWFQSNRELHDTWAERDSLRALLREAREDWIKVGYGASHEDVAACSDFCARIDLELSK